MRMMRLGATGRLALVGLCALGCSALGCSTLGEIGAGSDPADGGDFVNGLLGLTTSQRVRPIIDARESGDVVVSLPMDGEDRELILEPASVRSSFFQLFVQGADGEITQVRAPASTTVRGSVVGLADSVVTGSMMADGLHARVALAPDRVFWMEPVARVRADFAGEYVVYRDEDTVDVPMLCGLEHAAHGVIEDPDNLVLHSLNPNGLAIAELAVDADYEFFSSWGGVDQTVARMEAVIAAVNVQYEAEVGIRHVVSTAIVRTTPDDPYVSTDPVTMVQDELREEWLANHGDIQRDAVHLFTGKDIDGSTVGIAYVGAVCTSFAFGLSQSNVSSNFACVTDLTAHELGHNWAAQHCNCPGYTMNPWLTCANTFNPDLTVPTIEGHRDSRSCLSFGDACPEDPDKTEPGQCGCGVPDTDADLDGVADCNDGCADDGNKTEPGQCGCGVVDAHSDGDGVADCNDGCPVDTGKLEPGQCGCGVPDTDSDGDGVADCNDGCPRDPGATDPSQCAEPYCGDGMCNVGEDCASCESDCGVCPPSCGDGTCAADESSCDCPTDCGAAPATENSCSDGADDDCDLLVDCEDPDCAAAASCAPSCEPDGAACSAHSECCSGRCRGKGGNKTCEQPSGQGGGSDQCAQPGEACAKNSDCCARECRRTDTGRVCLEPPAGVLSASAGSGEPGDDPSTVTHSAPGGDDGSGGLMGGCTSAASGSGAGPGLLLCIVLLASTARRRRRNNGERRR